MEGSNFFEIISKDPKRMNQFNMGMSTQGTAFPVLGMYPFDSELSNATDLDHRPLLVDVGGGRGQALLQIKAACPSLKGRVILQDEPSVLEATPDAELPGIEKMSHDFFTIQPIRSRPPLRLSTSTSTYSIPPNLYSPPSKLTHPNRRARLLPPPRHA